MRLIRNFLSFIIIFIIIINVFNPATAFAQSDEIKREVNVESGKVSFIGPAKGSVLPANQALDTSIRPQDPAMALAIQFAPEFGIQNPQRDLSEKKTTTSDAGRITTRFQQSYQGIPVIAGELIVNTNENGDLYSMNGEVSAKFSLQTEPTVDSAQATETTLEAVAKWYELSTADFVATEPELWIFDESLLQPSNRPVELVWRFEVIPVDNNIPVRELVLVNAQSGNITFHFNQIDTAWHAVNENIRKFDISRVDHSTNYQNILGNENEIIYVLGTPLISTYTSNNTTTLPGSFLCDQSQPACTNDTNPDADAAHTYSLGTYNLYASHHSRDSINNSGMTIISSVDYSSNYQNAFWSGIQMVYGDGYPLADDVVAHELTHGVTQYESNLFYYYQSGAINESFSDLWGEYYDQTNGQGNDAANVKWLIGEDVPGSAFRNMSNPPAYSDPDKMTSAFYITSGTDDGGVHSNSGVNNKAVYLIVDGGTFNNKTVTQLGWDKTAKIYYEAQTNLLTSGADYSDLYYALQQACANLVGQHGITTTDCEEVKDALDAVEMNLQPIPNFNTDAPICLNDTPVSVTADDFENGLGQWSFTNSSGSTRWQLDSPLGQFTQSGQHSLYADDFPASVTDASARWVSFNATANTYLHFAHAYEFEANGSSYYDGGVLEYSINGGSTWVDAGSLMDYNGYDNTILVYAGNNPLEGRSAFVGSSHGYISTRVNLSPLTGQTVIFRWRMGLDESVAGLGWWVDNIQVYTCGSSIFGDVDVFVGGSLKGNYDILNEEYLLETYPGQFGGPVLIDSTNGTPLVTSLRLLYNNKTFSELMGVPTSQLLDDYWMPLYIDNATHDSQIRFTNTSTTQSTTVQVYIGGVLRGTYPLAPSSAERIRYTGISGGPVRIVGTPGVPILAGMRVIYGGTSSFDEIMAYPTTQLTNEYWFPFYNHNNVNLDTEVRIANTSAVSSSTVTVNIGGTPMGSYMLAPLTAHTVTYAGVSGGPVQIVGTVGVPLVTSLRLLYNNKTFSELMGVPTAGLLDDYSMPVYLDNSVTDSQVRFTNTSTTLSTTVQVFIGGMLRGTYPLAPSSSQRIRYTGLSDGPVQIVGTPGVPILAGMRIIYGGNSSFDEIMAYPTSQLEAQYWFPFYNHNNINLDTQVRIGVP